MADNINCPYCGKLTDPKLEACPHCGGPLRVRPPRPPGAQAQAQAGNQCPNCGARVQEGDIICVECGTNLLTGQRVTEAERAQAPRRRGRWRNALPYVLGGILLVAVAGLAGGFIYYLVQNPVSQARELAAQGQVLEALNLLDGYVEEHPANADAQMLLGKLHWKSQQYAEAAQNFEAAASSNPEREEPGLLAVAALGQLSGDAGRQRQLAALRNLVEKHPENQQALYLLALAEGAAGNLERQERALQRLLQMDPTLVKARRALAAAQGLQGEPVEGRQQLVQAEAPERGENGVVLGSLADLQGQEAEVEALLTGALQDGTKVDALVHTRLGLYYLARGVYEQALRHLGDAKEGPNPPQAAAFFYALALQSSGLLPEALQAFDRIASGTGPYAGEAAVQMALAYAQQGEVQPANQALTRAMQAGHTTAKVYTIQGYVHAQEGNYEDAMESFRTAIRTDAQYAPAHLELGLQHISRGSLSQGLRELERYLELAANASQQKLNEIELLVNQLKQTLDQGGGAAATEG